MVTPCAQQFPLCSQHIDDIAGADLKAGFRRFQCLDVRLDGARQRIHPADAGDDAGVVVARLALGGALLLFL
jgi:hypothetical protein